ncbi:MAG: thioredoxin domain-containing protein [Actinobacteria bacterium]|uniref:Unannotated protein n=1 Tax=freshwater metagenome TaxID=449393 RepID=A0A6J7KBJ6_9ZZZZ|nr:thioredoxin domain-containing protein [Actinomycetota bacterium]
MSANSQGKSQKPVSAKDRRDKAAAARAAQEAAEKRRDRMIKIVGGLGVLVVVGAIIGGAVWQSRSNSSANGSTVLPSPNPDAPLPKGVVNSGENAYAVPYGNAPATAPLLQVWEDFQCPACKSLEDANGQGIEELATSGKARLFWRPTAFLDPKLAVDNLKNKAPDSSHRAIAAWGCAIDAGKSAEYHDIAYKNQPAIEGTGYTSAALLDFGKQSGISGDAYTTFETCVNDGTYLGWAVNSLKAFNDAAVPGTPAGYLNGTEIQSDVLSDKAKLDELVAGATT